VSEAQERKADPNNFGGVSRVHKMIKIDKNVAIPIIERGGVAKYPWNKMEIGDSFFIEGAKTTTSITSAASPYGKRHNKKFTARAVDGGVRIWRIE
jgi:hypothetical protein